MKKLLIFTFILLSFLACKNDIEVVNKLTFSDNLPDLKAINIEIIYSDSGYVKLKTFAPLLEDYSPEEKPYTEFSEGIKTVFYDNKQKITSELSANYAILLKDEHLWELKRNVILKNVRGEILKTEHLFFNEEKEILYTKEFVTIITVNGSKISGKGGFESNFSFTEYKFIDVSGKYNFNTD